MVKTDHFLTRFICLSMILTFNVHWGVTNNNTQGEEMNSQGVIKSLLISFVIGNVVAWSMGAYPIEITAIPYSEEDLSLISELQEEIRSNPDEVEIKTDLGELYFVHNDLDKVDKLLKPVISQKETDPNALAIWSANEAKQAGAMWDFTWGIWKLNRLANAEEGLNRAVNLDPENLNIRMYRIHTFLGIKRDSSFYTIFEDEQWFLNHLEIESDYFLQGLKQQFYAVFSKAYTSRQALSNNIADQKSSLRKAKAYLDKLKDKKIIKSNTIGKTDLIK